MDGLIWFAVGLACGSAIGYEELEKKLKLRLKKIKQRYRIQCTDEDGNDIPIEDILKKLISGKEKW